jgi:hypothetical protein
MKRSGSLASCESTKSIRSISSRLTTKSIKIRPVVIQKVEVNATPEKIGVGLFAKDQFPLTSMKETPMMQTPQH